MDRRAAWVLGIVFGGFFLCLFGFMLLVFFAFRGDSEPRGLGRGGSRVGVVEIVGPISDSKKALKELREFEQSPRIKAIVVRVDSPGGAVGPSQEIYQAIRKLRAHKKVIASMGSIAASGGFYIAEAADVVFANPGTLTGSIGVVFELPNVQGLLKWAGVEMNTLTAGKMKDAGSPFREMTPEERTYFEGVLADVHEQFIAAVAEGRRLKVEEVRPFADGRVFTGRKAKQLRLVDELGGLQEAVAYAGKVSGLGENAEAEYPKEERHFLRELLSAEAKSWLRGVAADSLGLGTGGGLQYQMPGFKTP
jgi:protease IV